MRITILCPHLRIAGGVRAILTYADRLARRGHDVELVVPSRRRYRTAWRTLAKTGPAWMPSLVARVRWVTAWAPGALRDADVVVATAWQSARVVAAAPARCGARFYLIQHYESLYHGDPGSVDETYRLPLRQVVISSWLRDVMRERFNSEAEVLVTPVDPALFHRVEGESKSERPRVLMLHHDYAWKGVADGLAAIARVREHGSGIRVVGFGVKAPRDGAGYDEFHANPAQDRLRHIYSSADVFLCPSWDEGLGMPSMEAMACGAALVTYDNGGSRDYARDGVTALVARRRDVADLSRKLEQLIVDPAARTRIAAAGRQHVVTAYDWDRAVERIETIFGEAVGRDAARVR